MNDKTGLPFDPYNFSEIEKIQSDIERDLNSHEIPTLEPEPEILKVPAVEFYTETIKQIEPVQHIPQKPYRRLIISLLLICTLGTGTLGVGIGFGFVLLQNRIGISDDVSGYTLQDAQAAPVVDSTRLVFGNDGDSPAREGSLADVVRLVDPAVVRISTTFQGHALFPFGGGSHNYRGGSGIIIDKDDDYVYIVTINHVILGADSVYVYIMDHDPISARLVGRNHAADLAVISVPVAEVHGAGIRDVRVASFGDSDAMMVGDVVLAIGNAMGEGNSTTSGIISAAEKELQVAGGRTMRVLQTDAAINPGNSGGPLVNKRGQVIGINTVTGTTDHYAIEGMGFSIPSNIAMPIIENIMNSAPGPVLGIRGENVSERVAAELGIPPIGVRVDAIIQNSGADHAGIARGDIITSFNGRAVFNMEQLVEEIAKSNVGDTVEVMIIREGRRQIVLQVTLGENTRDNF